MLGEYEKSARVLHSLRAGSMRWQIVSLQRHTDGGTALKQSS
jgi:hypothetical protein